MSHPITQVIEWWGPMLEWAKAEVRAMRDASESEPDIQPNPAPEPDPLTELHARVARLEFERDSWRARYTDALTTVHCVLGYDSESARVYTEARAAMVGKAIREAYKP